MITPAASSIVLEPPAQKVAEAFSKPPFLWEMTPANARKVLEEAQAAPVSKRASKGPDASLTPGRAGPCGGTPTV